MQNLWIEVDAPHCRIVNLARMDILYVSYRSASNWTVVGQLGHQDVHLRSYTCEADAKQWVLAMLHRLNGN